MISGLESAGQGDGFIDTLRTDMLDFQVFLDFKQFNFYFTQFNL